MILHREIPINVPTPYRELEDVPVLVSFDTDTGIATVDGAVIGGRVLSVNGLSQMCDMAHVTRAAQEYCSDNINAMIADEWLGQAAE